MDIPFKSRLTAMEHFKVLSVMQPMKMEFTLTTPLQRIILKSDLWNDTTPHFGQSWSALWTAEALQMSSTWSLPLLHSFLVRMHALGHMGDLLSSRPWAVSRDLAQISFQILEPWSWVQPQLKHNELQTSWEPKHKSRLLQWPSTLQFEEHCWRRQSLSRPWMLSLVGLLHTGGGQPDLTRNEVASNLADFSDAIRMGSQFGFSQVVQASRLLPINLDRRSGLNSGCQTRKICNLWEMLPPTFNKENFRITPCLRHHGISNRYSLVRT